MADPRHTQPPGDVERALHDLGSQLDWPVEPSLVPGFRQSLASRPDRRLGLARWWPAASLPRLGWTSVALVVLFALVITVSDSTPSTVADRLGLPGVSISTDPTATLTPSNDLQLGDHTTLNDALSRAGDELVMPPDAILGPPDEVYVLDHDGTVQVSYIYYPRSDLREVGKTGIGLLISQFQGHTNDSFVQKQIGPNTTVALTEVNGQRAFWLAGEPHVFYYERPDGQIYEETIRLAANTLLWEQNGMTLRIETILDREAAVRIAEAMSETR